jgi:hypothetical protein
MVADTLAVVYKAWDEVILRSNMSMAKVADYIIGELQQLLPKVRETFDPEVIVYLRQIITDAILPSNEGGGKMRINVLEISGLQWAQEGWRLSRDLDRMPSWEEVFAVDVPGKRVSLDPRQLRGLHHPRAGDIRGAAKPHDVGANQSRRRPARVQGAARSSTSRPSPRACVRT